MINTNYLQMLKVDEDIQHVYLESVQEIEDIVAPIRVLEMRRQQEMELGIFTESADILYTEGVKEAVTKLGDKIIEIINRIKDFIKSIPEKFKEATWNKANVDKRMEMIKKDDPKRYETMKVYIDKGMLDFNTFESMKSFYDSYDDLISELKKKDADEKTLKGKLEKLKKSVNNNSDTIKNVAAALGIVATAGTIALTYKKFRNESDKFAENQAGRIADAANKRSKETEALAKILDDQLGEEITGTTKGYILAQATVELEKQTKVSITKLTRFRAFAWKKFDVIATKFSKTGGDQSILQAVKQDKIRGDLHAEAERLGKVASYNRSLHNTQSNRQRPIVDKPQTPRNNK